MVPCMCVCVCIKRTRTWTITCTQTYMPAHPFHPFGSIRIQWHSHTHTQMHTCTHTHMHACIRIYWHIHTHTYTYMHLYTHTTHTFLRWSYMHILAHTYIQTDRRIISWLFQHFPHSENSQDWPLGISTCGSLGHPFLCRAPCIRAVHGTCMKGPRSGMGRDGPLWLSWCQL